MTMRCGETLDISEARIRPRLSPPTELSIWTLKLLAQLHFCVDLNFSLKEVLLPRKDLKLGRVRKLVLNLFLKSATSALPYTWN